MFVLLWKVNVSTFVKVSHLKNSRSSRIIKDLQEE